MRLAAPSIALAVLVLAACTGNADVPVASTTEAVATADSEPAVTAPPAPEPEFVAPELLTVDPALIADLDVAVEESLDEDLYTYVAFPVLPNGEELTDLLREAADYRLTRFREVETSASGDTRPELTMSWDLVGASTRALGVRLASSEVGGEAFDGKSETVWLDVDARERVWTDGLFEPERVPALLDRILDAALADPRIDEQMLYAQMDGELEAFDSVGFTPSGDLWVEFDRAQVSTSTTPIGVAVDPEDALSEFGLLAQESALNPEDPALQPVVATPTPSPGETPDPAATNDPGGDPAVPVPAPTDTAAPNPAPPTVQDLPADTDCSQERCLALTFDDGPVAGTHELLDVLADRGVKATFFLVGKNASAHPDVVRRIVADGHAIGNHTWDHPQLTRLDEDSIRSEIERAADAIEDAGGVRPTLLRPPYGATNDTVAEVAAELGLPQVLWDVDPEDWRDKNTPIVTERVIDDSHRGAIVLSHDVHATTRAAYAAIIDTLLADGYTLVTVPDLIDDMTPGERYFHG